MSALVSVIVPTHNRPHFLGRTIDSLLAQTYGNVEIVVVDDNEAGSDARRQTSELIDGYLSKGNIKYVQNPHPLGGGPARNAGIKAAAGDYVTFLDDDDIYLPEKVETQLNYMLQNGLEMSFTDVFLHDADDKLIEYRRHSYVNDCSNRELMRQHILHSLCPTSTYMIKRSVLLETDGFRPVPMGQDFMLMLDMIEHGTKIGYFPVSYIVQYLHNEGRISVGKNKLKGEKALYEIKKTKFSLLTAAERRYVRFRHMAVLSVTYKRSSRYIEAAACAVASVAMSPLAIYNEIKRIHQNRRLADSGQRETL